MPGGVRHETHLRTGDGRTVLVRAERVTKRFGRRLALAPLDFELRQGETVALVGPNGAGKSTLVALLAGALEPSGGRIAWEDGIRVGWAPQRPAQYGRLTARENLELFARLERAGDPDELLERFELPSDRPSEQLSVGNRQRLNVAIGLLGDPDVLLLDEPTASLDPAQRRRLWETAAGDGRAVLFATQHLDEAERHAERIVALRDGELVPYEGLFE